MTERLVFPPGERLTEAETKRDMTASYAAACRGMAHRNDARSFALRNMDWFVRALANFLQGDEHGYSPQDLVALGEQLADEGRRRTLAWGTIEQITNPAPGKLGLGIGRYRNLPAEDPAHGTQAS